MNTEGAVVIVTGGGSGLGEACTRLFIENGAYVGILDLDESRGEKVAAELGSRALFCRTDVVSSDSVYSSVGRVVEAFGSLHGAVNCAGVGNSEKVLSKKGSLSMDSFNRVVQVNLVGTMNVLTQAAERIVTNLQDSNGERGVIINTASTAAFDGQIGQAAYSASKAGVVGMTLPIAREFADYGIRLMGIAPGLFDTPMLAALPLEIKEAIAKTIPFPKRMGKPEEFARLVLDIFENPFLNGEVIRLDGALRMAAR